VSFLVFVYSAFQGPCYFLCSVETNRLVKLAQHRQGSKKKWLSMDFWQACVLEGNRIGFRYLVTLYVYVKRLERRL